MPKCNKCNEEFPNWVVINGKNRCLNKRKYCLSCSPFGKHNTSQIHLLSVNDKNRVCKFCKKEFEYNKSKGNTGEICRSCRANVRRYAFKEILVKYKGGKCENCGYSKYIAALEFHHNDPKIKEFRIGGNHSRSIESLKKEVDKCTLLCSICHLEHHMDKDSKYELYGFSKYVE